MYLSLNWLKDFVQLPKKMTPDELAVLLTLHTVEVDGVVKQSDKFKNVVVGKILKIDKHPNADRLQVAVVKVGKEDLQIVCGAPNIAVGQMVPVALVGAILPNGLEIKEAEVRGVKSCGMMCASDELGIGSDHSGIFLLDAKAKLGQLLADYLQLDDSIIEVDNKSITNRPDLWSHMGMARDMAVFLDTKFSPCVVPADILKSDKEEKLTIKIEDNKACPRYMAIAMDNIKIEASPKWMQDRLTAADVRPINNIVDITNYVMLELGQPMHAFDRSLVNEIVVRRAKKDEAIETLDAIKRQLTSEDLVIADKEKAIAIAGIMGSSNSEINNSTTSIILESANFDPIVTRKTSSRLALRTDALMRFEKSLDPNMCDLAIRRAVQLIKQIIPGVVVSSALFDASSFSLNQGPIIFDIKEAVKKIGIKIAEKKILDTLTGLGFTFEKTGHVLQLTVPTWRATKDISIVEDVIEEIARMYGYDNITPVLPDSKMLPAQMSDDKIMERKIKNLLSSGAALSEAYNYSFVGEDQLKKLGVDFSNHIRLVNPISNLHTMLRQTLAVNLFGNIKTNQARFAEFGIFEIGSIYLSSDGEINKDNFSGEKLPYQERRLGIAMAGSNADVVYAKTKGIIEYLANSFDAPVVYQPTVAVFSWAQANYTADIIVNGIQVGSIMKLDSNFAKQNGIKKDVVVVEIGMNQFFRAKSAQSAKKFQEFEKFPAMTRDLAFVIDSKVVYNDIKNVIAGFDILINKVELFDVYEGDKLGAGKRSMAFHVVYQADKTLTAVEVDVIQNNLIKHLEEKFEAKVRNF